MGTTLAEAPRTPTQLINLTRETFGDGPLTQLVRAEVRAMETPGSVITACTLNVVPAYLQTAGYTKALFEEYDEVSPFKREGLLIRQARSHLLGDMGVRRNVFISPAVLRQQLRVLNEVYTRPYGDLSLRVLRPQGVRHAGGSFVDVAVPGQEPFIVLNGTAEDMPITDPAAIASYHEAAVSGLGWRSLPEPESYAEVQQALSAAQISE